MHLNTIHDTHGTYCQNCGWGSHCGTPRYTTIKDYICDGGEYRDIKICDHCRCKKCNQIKKDNLTINE